MMLRLLLGSAVLIFAVFGFCGCSGNNAAMGSSAGTTRTGQVTFAIKWPTRSRLIPMAAECIVVHVSGANGFYVSQEADRPTNGSTSILNFQLPPHGLAAVASAYPQVGGKGVAQATGTVAFTPMIGQTTQVILTMNSTIDHLTITPGTSHVDPGKTEQLAATAYNAAGAVVLTLPGNISWTSSNTAIATVDPSSGIVTGIGTGKVTITATEKESGKQGTAAVSVWNGKSHIYVANETPACLMRIDDMNGLNFTTFGTPGAGTGQFGDLDGIAFGPDGKIYMEDWDNNRIVRIDDMTGAGWVTLGGYTRPYDIAVGPDGKIYVANCIANNIVRVDDMTGKNWTTLGSNESGTNQFSNPTGIAIGQDGKIYVADRGNSRIVRIDDMTGKNWTTFGSQGSGTNQFSGPSRLAIGIDGKIYVTDTGNCRVVCIDDMTGKNWTTFGGPGNGMGQIEYPWGIAVDNGGFIYVVDNNHIVRMDDMTGKGWVTYDGTGSSLGKFTAPDAIAISQY